MAILSIEFRPRRMDLSGSKIIARCELPIAEARKLKELWRFGGEMIWDMKLSTTVKVGKRRKK